MGTVSTFLCDTLEDYWADSMTWDELLDLVEIKVGSTNDLARRGREYRACEEDYVLFSWSFFVAPRRMLLERLCHLSLMQLQAQATPSLCSCHTIHREYYNYRTAGGFSGVKAIGPSLTVESSFLHPIGESPCPMRATKSTAVDLHALDARPPCDYPRNIVFSTNQQWDLSTAKNEKPATKANGTSGLLAATKAYLPAVAWYFRAYSLFARLRSPPPGVALHTRQRPERLGIQHMHLRGLGLVARCRRQRRAISPLPLPIPKLMPTPILIHDIRSRGRTGEEARPTPDPSASTAPATVDRRTTAATSTVPSPTLASHTKGVQFAHSPAFSPTPSPSHKASTLGLGVRMKHFASLRSRSQRDDKPPSSFVGGQTLAPRFTVVCGGRMGLFVPACIILSFRHLARSPLPLAPLPLLRQVEKERRVSKPLLTPLKYVHRKSSPIWLLAHPRLRPRAPAAGIRPFAPPVPIIIPTASPPLVPRAHCARFGSLCTPAFPRALPPPECAHSDRQPLGPLQPHVYLDFRPRRWFRALAARILAPRAPPPFPARSRRRNVPIQTDNPLAHPNRMSTSIFGPTAGSARSLRTFWLPTHPRRCPCAPAAGFRPIAPLPRRWFRALAARVLVPRAPPPFPARSCCRNVPIQTANPLAHSHRMST
ncbi:hypothetical protein B0H19DRAFT_1265777 [Mycena capillaripes]|nr:hypothetical protein B0H19DRAFT_1265777 [Mycena capillaripes]